MGDRYVQSCVAHVSFPSTLPELRRAYNAGGGYMEMELLLDTAKGHDRTYSAPRWMTTGDVMFFYHTKRAKLRIERFLSAAKGPDNEEWGEEGKGLQTSIDYLNDQLAVAERYAGTIFGCTEVIGGAAFQKGDADRHWRNNIYAPIGDVHIFKNPLRDSEFGSHIKINPGGTFTPLHGSSFSGLKGLLAQTNDLPPYLAIARPGGVSFRDIDANNWIDIACSPDARFIDESQLRAYLIDYLLEGIKDPRTAVHQECRCEVKDGQTLCVGRGPRRHRRRPCRSGGFGPVTGGQLENGWQGISFGMTGVASGRKGPSS
ncbi:hypothetical protein [Humisphaera borealis]|uniref:Uncharacterized protein n=1 Tax=Humisphaera borealis TaxID=2807512 RepID=A0A7M2WVA5_9BACT|nr:hypothetical protein [Humisphaera borealis]QOV89487.1 hypothetical protein IPV69_25380 [Humisphaera borealis]